MSKDAMLSANKTWSLEPRSLDEAMKYAELMAKSSIVPEAFRGKPGDILVAIQLGAEIGVSPVQALANIAVINGRPCMWGDLILGLVRGSGKLDWIREKDDGETATCTVQRRDEPEPVSRTVSNRDAEAAGLLRKPGPWQQYRARMRQMRARSWALRDVFADVLKGIGVREEVEDYETVATTAPGVEIQRPRRRSQPPIEIASPLPDAAPPPSPDPSTTPEPHPPAPAAPPEISSTPAAGNGLTRCGVVAFELRDSARQKGKQYAQVTLAFADGTTRKASAWDGTVRDALAEAYGAGLAVDLQLKESSDGKWTSIEKAKIIGPEEG
jgi:hypothetical protein